MALHRDWVHPNHHLVCLSADRRLVFYALVSLVFSAFLLLLWDSLQVLCLRANLQALLDSRF